MRFMNTLVFFYAVICVQLKRFNFNSKNNSKILKRFISCKDKVLIFDNSLVYCPDIRSKCSLKAKGSRLIVEVSPFPRTRRSNDWSSLIVGESASLDVAMKVSILGDSYSDPGEA